MVSSVNDFTKVFFIGVAGTGMSALAQYLAGSGKIVSGSDRYFVPGTPNETREKLETAGINCFLQNGEGITGETQLVVVSTAVEDSVPEVQKAKALSIPIIKRSELLALIARDRKTIAIGGTSGKSTTAGMLYNILSVHGLDPGIISGAGLISLINKGLIGNAAVGSGWLIIEADESDGSIVQYEAEIGVLLNVDKDHQELDELMEIFTLFKHHSKQLFVVNQANPLARALSANSENDFTSDPAYPAGYTSMDFAQKGMEVSFKVTSPDQENGLFTLHTVGKHNMGNALAAVTVAHQLGVSMQSCIAGISDYEGIFRRHQLLGIKNGIKVIDDYAHNPVTCAASISACQGIAKKVIAWFQPHGYGPTRFLKNDFIQEISSVLRAEDEIWMSEIFYAGGTAEKNISANELIEGIKTHGKNAFFVAERDEFLDNMRSHITGDCVILLMGARDPGLELFAKKFLTDL